MRIRKVDDIGAVARQRRRDLGLSQAEIANRAGVTRQWLVRFEQGNSEVSLSKAFAVLLALNLKVRVDPLESQEVGFNVRIPKMNFTIPRVVMPKIDTDELTRQLTRTRPIDTKQLHSEVREKLKQLDAAKIQQEPAHGDR